MYGNASIEDVDLWDTRCKCSTSSLGTSSHKFQVGKTALVSTIVSELLERYRSQAHAAAYFYCDYKDPNTHNPINILGALARQVATQNEECFQDVKQFYEKLVAGFDDLTITPTVEELSSLIAKLSAHFTSVMVVVDGLDEVIKQGSYDRSDVAQILQELNTPTGTIKILFASRHEVDLRHPLQKFQKVSFAAMSSNI